MPLPDSIETLQDFHHHVLTTRPSSTAAIVAAPGAGQCFVYSSCQSVPPLSPHQRRDFYKIYLLKAGTGRLHYASRSLEVAPPALIFSNPLVPYSVERDAGTHEAIYCSFNAEFWQSNGRPGQPSLAESPLFRPGGSPVLLLNELQLAVLEPLFQQLVAQAATDYVHRYEVIHNYVELILHEALKIDPPTAHFSSHNAAGRVASLFLELLTRQFPLLTPTHQLRLRTPHDYAAALAIHVNYLNRAVQAATGKTTTAHLAERLVQEATVLLQSSYWSVAEISDSLGFAYPTYFNRFFKKHTGLTPLQMRQAELLPA
ncbi:helix-turn-helix domain-containing protein [Hymenobacter sp. GOD-10R]|uniref:helix-turn-helix domain-containing protein n=1 Tax=Hymenobacter sp. GOD-10R TaxID=3093922 RepID=UPI002D77D432|nr:helix-turn-helix domain-containing protein [Hymenobacter sp. GOD-10R]WRQ30852.1 helix-turn-helix domain-containing protein [Hymenobacter sp. GOD-10R]